MEELNKICRLCLDQDAEEMHQIFDECLNNKIVITTGLDVSEFIENSSENKNSIQ